MVMAKLLPESHNVADGDWVQAWEKSGVQSLGCCCCWSLVIDQVACDSIVFVVLLVGRVCEGVVGMRRAMHGADEYICACRADLR